MHKLLLRQLRKAGIEPDEAPDVEAWQQFLLRVEQSYVESDEGRYLLERSLMLTSQEMQGLYESLSAASETRIAAERDKLRAVLASLGDGLCILNGEGRVVSLNPAGEAVLGCMARDCVGRSLDELVTIHSRGAPISVGALMSGNHALREEDGLFVSSDGRSLPTAFTFTPIHHDALHNGAVLVVRDVTERRALEAREAKLRDELERSQRLESLGVLAGGIAHDLNNVLGPIVAYPDIFREELPPGSPLLEDVTEIEEAVRRAIAVIQDLLALARHSSGRLTRVKLGARVRRCLRGPDWAAVERRYPDLRLDAQVETEDVWVDSTPGHVTRTLLNLTRHAAQVMDGQGRLEVRIDRRLLAAPVDGYERIPPGDYLVLSVADDGPGLAGADVRRLFEPFYAKRALGYSGTGLGLAVVYALVRDSQGFLDVHTSETGTRFEVYYRVAVPPERAPHRPTRGAGERILVVDDIPGQRALARRLLTSLGYRVDTVESGREAIEYLATNQSDLVVLDMVMEDDFDGCDTLRAIRRLRPKQRCIIATGYAETDRVRQALALGASGYLRKPYTRDAVGEAIRVALDA